MHIALLPDISSGLPLRLVQFIDVGQLAGIIMAPEDRVAVIAGSHQTVFCQPLASQVGQVLVLHHSRSECTVTVDKRI